MPDTTQPRGDARREAIVDAAFHLFATHGYRGTSVARVAEHVGVTDAGVLYHFKTKTDLLLAVLARYDEQSARLLSEASGTGDPADELQALREWGAVMEADPDYTSLLVTLSAEHLVDDSAANTYFRRRYEIVRRRYEQVLSDAVDAGLLKSEVDPATEAVRLVALLDGLRLQWFFSDGKVSIAEAVRTHVDALTDPLADVTTATRLSADRP